MMNAEMYARVGGKALPEDNVNVVKGVNFVDEEGQPVSIQGPKGDTGPQGVQGPKGDTGPQGVQGPKGDTGPQGVQGPKGDTGPQGVQGPKGDTGPQGVQGPKGDTGPQGKQGAQGVQGAKGDVGLPALVMKKVLVGEYPVGSTFTGNVSEWLNRTPLANEYSTALSGDGKYSIVWQCVSQSGSLFTGKTISRQSIVGPQGPAGQDAQITKAAHVDPNSGTVADVVNALISAGLMKPA